MNSLQLDLGGRPVANDDFLVLQDRDAALGLPALLFDLGPCVVSGCRVYATGSVWNVAPGTVWDGATLLPFPGASNAALPAMFAPGAGAVVDARAYQSGGTKTTIWGQNMALVPVDPAQPGALVVDQSGALTFWQRVQERTREVGTVEYVTDTSGYDTTGLGVGPKRGWGLCNGQGGRADLRGHFVAGMDPGAADYARPGLFGGEAAHMLSADELPRVRLGASVPAFPQTIQYGSGNSGGSPESAQQASTELVLPGGGQAHENRPPFYVLAARQWVGF